MNSSELPTVRAFVSYSWSSDDHIRWVVDLADRLNSDGVDLAFDKWDLKPGNDPNAFMESMVTDRRVTKVLLICDKVYAEKANSREGGVGKEAQILTAEIYEKVDQDKYAALITQRDENGKAYVPAYYGGRQYIDFADPDVQEDSYQELLRWIYDKPKYVRPKRGTAPTFITDPGAASTNTNSRFKRADDAIRNAHPSSGGLIAEFGHALLTEFEDRRPSRGGEEPWDEQVLRGADTMRPALQNLLHLVLAEARFAGGNLPKFLAIFEKIASLMYRPPEIRSWNEDDYDSYAMIAYEGFLATIAILIDEGRFDLIELALNHAYLIANRPIYDGSLPSTTTFRVFFSDVASMRARKERIQSRQNDLYAEIVADTYRVGFPTLKQMIQADLLLYLRSSLIPDGTDWISWWPRLLIFAERVGGLDLFARSESLAFFLKWMPHVFGEMTIDEYRTKIPLLQEQMRQVMGYYFGPNLTALTNVQNVGKRA